MKKVIHKSFWYVFALEMICGVLVFVIKNPALSEFFLVLEQIFLAYIVIYNSLTTSGKANIVLAIIDLLITVGAVLLLINVDYIFISFAVIFAIATTIHIKNLIQGK